MEEQRIVHSFRKNETEEVRVSLRSYKDRNYVDLRLFYEAEGQLRPTRKGITLGSEFLQELKRGIEKTEQALAVKV